MKKLLALVLLAINLTGCSSTEVAKYEPNPCVTDWESTVKDGRTVSSHTRVQCTDRPQINHVVKDVGVASDCRVSRPVGVAHNDPKYGETLLCKFTDPLGKTVWRPVNEVLSYPSFN